MVSCRSSTSACTKIGRFPHPSDCGRYVDCVPSDTTEDFLVNEGHCHGFPYSPSLRRCVSNEEEPSCVPKVPRRRRGISFPNETFNFLCPDDKSKTGCHNCQLRYECISGQAYIEFCSAGSTCSDAADFGGGACLPYRVTETEGKCKCENIGVTQDSYNEEYFIFCDINFDPPKMKDFKCPDGQTFHSGVNTCVDRPQEPCSQEPAIPACGNKIKTKVNPNNCAWSYTCIPGDDAITTCCKGNQYYDEKSKLCKDICKFESGPETSELVCTGKGKVADKNNCTKYHLCGDEGDDQLLDTVSCPEGTYFKDTSCVSGPLPEDCITSTFSYSNCPGYDDIKARCPLNS
ncbi:uncharacterized protein [Palaemon carinicauda]|uniref:uncharacterized protein n=1 Tax=Palaemon carinicauda TaxID=392227 RepID=UPI0035B5C010